MRTNGSVYDDERPQRREVGHALGPALDALNDFALNDPLGKQMVSWLHRRWPMVLFCDQQAFMSDTALRVSLALLGRTIKFGKLVEHVSSDQLFYGIVQPQVEPDGKRRRKSKTLTAAESPSFPVIGPDGAALLRPVTTNRQAAQLAQRQLRERDQILAFRTAWRGKRQVAYAPLGLADLCGVAGEAALELAGRERAKWEREIGGWPGTRHEGDEVVRDWGVARFMEQLAPAEPLLLGRHDTEENRHNSFFRRSRLYRGEGLVYFPPADARANPRAAGRVTERRNAAARRRLRRTAAGA